MSEGVRREDPVASWSPGVYGSDLPDRHVRGPGELTGDCDCTEVWDPYLDCHGQVAYGYWFLISPNCPVHWENYIKTVEEMKQWGTASNG